MTPLLICALSGRAMAQAARGWGFAPYVADCFGDLDMRAAAADWRRLESLDEVETALAEFPAAPLWLGAGFDERPDLAERLERRFSLIGSSSAAIRRAKDPAKLAEICHDLRLPHPETRFDPPPDPENWLIKRAGASGGAHVRPALGAAAGPGDYWQRRLPGRVVSVNLAPSIRHMFLNRLDPAPEAPFRFGGVYGPFRAPPLLEEAACALADALDLRFYCGVDFIVEGETWSVLEANPRPTAALPIFSARAPQVLRYVYARFDMIIPAAFDWPPFAADIPAPLSAIPAGAPVATISAGDWREAKIRAADLLRRLEKPLR